MKTGPLWQVTLRVNREAEEAARELMERIFRQPPSVFSPEASPKTVVSVYSRRATPLSDHRRQQIQKGLQKIKDSGLNPGGSGQLSVKRLKAQDWAESWKRHFKPLAIGSTLLVQPSWSRRRPRPNQSLVVLDPGLSFGTGQHPTTEFCLHQLVACRPAGRPASLFDLGTGSGILAIAGVKLGYKPVLAVDNDPLAVQAARANAEVNRVSGQLSIRKRDITRTSGSEAFDLICANLTADLLERATDRILNHLKPGGALVVAGVLESQFPQVRRVYEQAGLKLAAHERNCEWRSGRFQFRR